MKEKGWIRLSQYKREHSRDKPPKLIRYPDGSEYTASTWKELLDTYCKWSGNDVPMKNKNGRSKKRNGDKTLERLCKELKDYANKTFVCRKA